MLALLLFGFGFAERLFPLTCSTDAAFSQIDVKSADECSVHCASNSKCLLWTFTYGSLPFRCLLKGPWNYPFSRGKCTTGLHQPQPSKAEFPTPVGAKNVLFITVDDMRPAIGAYNDSLAHTPHMDQLASEGLLFTHAYAQISSCSPSRNSFLSGRRPDTTRAWNFRNHFREQSGANWISLPQYFKQHGYLVVGGGKIFHASSAKSNIGLPLNDYPLSWSDEHPYFDNEPKTNLYNCTNSNHESHRTWCSANVHKDDRILPDQKIRDNCIAHLQLATTQTRPFFVACGFHKPHAPFDVPRAFFSSLPPWSNFTLNANLWAPIGMPNVAWHYPTDVHGMEQNPSFNGTSNIRRAGLYRRAYYAAVRYADYNIGQILTTLSRLKLADSTIVIVFGDHGWHLGEQNTWAKMTNFEAATRIPVIIRVPWKKNVAGNQTRVLAEAVDIYPTLVDLAGLPSPISRGQFLNGTSLVRVFDNPEDVVFKSAAYSQLAKESVFSVSTQYARRRTSFMGYTIRVPEWRYTAWFAFNGTTLSPNIESVAGRELYDHRGDSGLWMDFPGESINLVNSTSLSTLVISLHQMVLDHIRLVPEEPNRLLSRNL